MAKTNRFVKTSEAASGSYRVKSSLHGQIKSVNKVADTVYRESKSGKAAPKSFGSDSTPPKSK